MNEQLSNLLLILNCHMNMAFTFKIYVVVKSEFRMLNGRNALTAPMHKSFIW